MTGREQVTLGGDTVEPDRPDTSEDYKFSRPQCVAATEDGDRCSNPVRRTDGDPEFCPRHYEQDGVEWYDDGLRADGGERYAYSMMTDTWYCVTDYEDLGGGQIRAKSKEKVDREEVPQDVLDATTERGDRDE